jgi:hypothetical protein
MSRVRRSLLRSNGVVFGFDVSGGAGLSGAASSRGPRRIRAGHARITFLSYVFKISELASGKGTNFNGLKFFGTDRSVSRKKRIQNSKTSVALTTPSARQQLRVRFLIPPAEKRGGVHGKNQKEYLTTV